MSKPAITHLMLDVACIRDYPDERPEYALVTLSPEYVAEILKYMDIASRLRRNDRHIYSLDRWDYAARYLCYFQKMETIQDIDGHPAHRVPRGEPILLAADPEPPDYAFFRIECPIIRIASNAVRWTATLKHTTDVVTSSWLSKNVLLDIHRRFSQSPT